jgi:hypothetical protein
MLLMMMFLKILTMFGVSKVLLLLEKLDPGWALFLKSPHLLYFALGGCTFPFKLKSLSICAKKNKKIKRLYYDVLMLKSKYTLNPVIPQLWQPKNAHDIKELCTIDKHA